MQTGIDDLVTFANLQEIRSIDDVEALILEEPTEFRRLLDGYFLILGERRLWWQRTADSDSPRWRECVRRAIVHVAGTSEYTPASLADLLDREHFPKAQARIMRIARELLYAKAAA